ncbi:MAG TPA: hypothetical protein VIV40_24375 [Kofleriaceae bacterium]
MDNILSKVNQLGICASEAAAARKAAKAYDRAFKGFDNAVTNAVGGGVAAGVALVGGVTCLTTAEAPPVLVVCFVSVLGGLVGSGIGVRGLLDAKDLAEEDMDEAESALAEALDKLCACIAAHLQPQS